jgi:excisionase family DNA binding protein
MSIVTSAESPTSLTPSPALDAALRDAVARLAGAAQQPGPWLTATEAAEYLRVAEGTLRNWTSMKYVPHVKRGRLVRYHRDELDRWMAGGARRGRKTLAN